MKLFAALAAITLIAAPAQAEWNTTWGNTAGQQMCAAKRMGATNEAAAKRGMDYVLQTPALRADFVQFAARMGQLAEMNAEIEMTNGFYKACPEYRIF